MSIRIPFAATSEDAQPLARCVERAADEAGISAYQAALIVSYFMEECAEQVSLNRVVNVPGFGRFGPLAWTPRKPGLVPFCYPAFSASRAFRAQVALTCPPAGPALDAVRKHRRHHHLSSRPDRRGSRPFSALRAFRERIVAQARADGMDV